MERSILKTGIPASVVVSVLAFSMLFPAAVNPGNNRNHGGDDHGYGNKCGYGQVQDNDENDNGDGGGGDQARRAPQSAGTSAATQTEKDREKKNHDNDCNEDEGDNGDGGGGGGDRTSIVNVTPVAPHYVVGPNRLGGDGE